MSDTHPSVGVVLPTHNRPEMLRRALESVLAQDYPGKVRAVVVYDRAEPDQSLAGERVQVMANRRTPGLAGARNTGILALDTDLVAFCDDDDVWLPGKLTAQVAALQAEPRAVLCSAGIVIDFNGRQLPRLAGRDRVHYAELVRDRLMMVHSSTYLARRAELIEIGMVDEEIPGSQGEDWDLALRAARRHPIVHVDRPYVRVLWGLTSYYAHAWETKVAALQWFLRRYPEIERDGAAAGRVYGQIAFGHACNGRRREALRWAGRALRANWKERRVPFALLVASGLVSGERVLLALHTRGRGI
ncbi:MULTISPECIES: glycosyltransferase family 2 protein [Thermomonospora]|uniref:Glycosyl transferase family 2 n=1 Tax=Thermomonospora curvata (strain ATCC 19995 / DSM 43183 / JCM 3096 / KCTC 9072 / NBRC 15933 / NCIMB 10081 / Henssen B9) TaxID=471852 RepID=D1A7K2_THECD|nr:MULTISPECIES: glycosyltransferase family 2 protein [Thermomonospora]ACY96591.1 glycosyl transferase family 2 [Thermomonospora curvata DSM 43183]PKK15399.1 MAG: glycosyltransferase family 2 protein [Thermomonospora sp. CIF 1]